MLSAGGGGGDGDGADRTITVTKYLRCERRASNLAAVFNSSVRRASVQLTANVPRTTPIPPFIPVDAGVTTRRPSETYSIHTPWFYR